ncbi:unnamed protein product [Macrosiphum euphorbiae]|uniref:Uncharacterized protein n=1 Tax=Macrosiphum euphorbiae TaxID=13131 RepID=A0AAV0WFC7_9HEMI|nr:unnamed protein product [Macrosiphum euphorbiae]
MTELEVSTFDLALPLVVVPSEATAPASPTPEALGVVGPQYRGTNLAAVGLPGPAIRVYGYRGFYSRVLPPPVGG